MMFLLLWTACTSACIALMLIGMLIVKHADARADRWLSQDQPEPMPDRTHGRGSFEVSGR